MMCLERFETWPPLSSPNGFAITIVNESPNTTLVILTVISINIHCVLWFTISKLFGYNTVCRIMVGRVTGKHSSARMESRF